MTAINDPLRVLVAGAGGIIGQTLRAQEPDGYRVTYARRQTDVLHVGVNLCDALATTKVLDWYGPQVIVNLAGESRPDVVEKYPLQSREINVDLVERLADWCMWNDVYLIQVSTQAVFSGDEPPYNPRSPRKPVNTYGAQKKRAEDILIDLESAHIAKFCIIRPTFVLGIRPLPEIGRLNPVEQMLEGQCKQVDDRWFSPAFAPDVARVIWNAVANRREGIIHAGVPIRVSRYDVAMALGLSAQPVSHESFAGLAQRPRDTTYGKNASHYMTFDQGIADCLVRWEARQAVPV
jgi:dTDP-4-dehydrorhamnose reductase